MVLCPHCDYKAITIQSINDLLETDHVELSWLGQFTANQIAAARNFEMFKEEATNIIKAMIEENTAIKQELFITSLMEYTCMVHLKYLR